MKVSLANSNDMALPVIKRRAIPSIELEGAKTLIKNGRYMILRDARYHAQKDFSFSKSQVVETLLNLKEPDFAYATKANLYVRKYMDVYKTVIGNTKVYIKLQHDREKNKIVLVSFKKNGYID